MFLVLCCGGDLATTSTARSNRDHAFDVRSSSLVLPDWPMTDNRSITEVLQAPEVADAVARVKSKLQDIVKDWTVQQWLDFGQAAMSVLNAFRLFPEELKGKFGAATESGIFAAQYGLFIAVWSQFELVIEMLIMKELRLSNQETSIVCGGLAFGSKIHMLLSLLARKEENSHGITLLKNIQSFADRNSFAHGFIHDETKADSFEFGSSTPRYSASLIKREIKYQYIVKMRPLDMGKLGLHVLEFFKKLAELKQFFKITDDDFKAYQKSIVDDALAQAAQAEHRQQLLTNARTAKRKRRGLPPE